MSEFVSLFLRLFVFFAAIPLQFEMVRGWAEIRSPIGECRTDFQSVCPAADWKSVLQNVQVISARALSDQAGCDSDSWRAERA